MSTAGASFTVEGRVRTDGGVASASGFGLSSNDEELDSGQSAGAETVAGLVALAE